jgi:nucleoside-diphosphate-sugar epimerase
MRIVLTGASSFTGFWFARALTEAGHEVIAPLSSPDSPDAYEGMRRTRVDRLKTFAHTRFAVPFGSDAFLDTLREIGPFDVFCHHWAEVRGYREPTFDAVAALAANTRRLGDVLRALKDAGCGSMVLTGSVFEQNEGVGNPPLRAFSPYGLSKGLTAALCDFYCEREGVPLDRFVIPNPFGPYEEPRFTDYLMRTWLAGGTARVGTPRYVRDNIHVGLLAKSYAGFVTAPEPRGGRKLGPSGYPESQGAFAARVAREVRGRTGLDCALIFAEQTEFAEPAIRINTTPTDPAALDWSERAAWDEFVRYYQSVYPAR